MQVIHHTLYNIKRRIPFPQIPGLIRAYLDKNGLKNGSFSYYFDEIVDSPDSFNEQMKTGSCARALKDCPLLGEIKFKSGEGRHFDTLFLSNDDSEGGCSEQDLSPLLNKIHRSYGFCETILSYEGIDFFGHKGSSSIEINKDFHGCWLTLNISLLIDGNVMDPKPLIDSFSEYFPGIKPIEGIEILLSDEEKASVQASDKAARSGIERAMSFFKEKLPAEIEGSYDPQIQYSTTKHLKVLAKQNGYNYEGIVGASYRLTKKTPCGHMIVMEVTRGGHIPDTSIIYAFQGVGFNHRLFNWSAWPCKQEIYDSCLDKIFEAVKQFEQEYLAGMDGHYPPIPSWFIADSA